MQRKNLELSIPNVSESVKSEQEIKFMNIPKKVFLPSQKLCQQDPEIQLKEGKDLYEFLILNLKPNCQGCFNKHTPKLRWCKQ